jgi:hypothetical protein
MRRWFGGCALALVLACAASNRAVAQDSAPSSAKVHSAKAASSKAGAAKENTVRPNASSKTTSAKNHARTATGKRVGTSGSAAGLATKTHSVAHPGAGAHAKPHTVLAASNGNSKSARSRKNSKGKATARGQQKIEAERAQAIQEALIREHYLDGEAAGSWNQASEDAMRKYQADHGWQSKTVPDARALISLGLGPSHERLLNPESAMTTQPEALHPAALTPASHSVDPGQNMPVPATAPQRDSSSQQ